MIPVTIHAYASITSVAADGTLRPDEKGFVHLHLPEALHRAAHHLPATTEHHQRLLQPVLVPVDEDGTYHDPQHRYPAIKVISVPYAGWRVDTDFPDGEAEVIDASGRSVVSFHTAHPTTGARPEQQAQDYLDDLRRRG